MRTLILLVALAAAASGCNNPRNDADAPVDRPADAAAGPAPAATDPASAATPSADAAGQPPADPMAPTGDTARTGDPLALGLLSAVNEHEIAAARQAKEKKVGGAVLEFANLMEKEHSANQSQTLALGTPSDSAEVKAMKDQGRAELDALGAKSGDDYRKAYVAAMIKGHQDALNLIDTKLLPAATGDAVKAHLRETREHVAMHLEQARKLPQ